MYTLEHQSPGTTSLIHLHVHIGTPVTTSLIHLHIGTPVTTSLIHLHIGTPCMQSPELEHSML